MRVRIWKLVCVLMWPGVVCAQGVGMARVEMTVRGPDGRAAANVEVEFLPASESTTETPVVVRTDPQGVAYFDWKEGVGQIAVRARGVGYGVTGAFDFSREGLNRPALTALIPFARIEGTLPAEFRGAGAMIVGYPEPRLNVPARLAVGEDGRFALELPAATWRLFVKKGDKFVALQQRAVRVNPGEMVRDVPWEAYVEDVPAQETRVPLVPERRENLTWVKGVLTDARGQPVAGATVRALATYLGGMRMANMEVETTSGADGSYAIQGLGDLQLFRGLVLATTPGRAPAWAWLNLQTPPVPMVLDLAFSDAPAALDVAVVREGKPLAGAMVAARLRGMQLETIENERLAERSAFLRAAIPMARAGADGVAHFPLLLPGVYDVVAAETNDEGMRALFSRDEKMIHGRLDGAALAGRETGRVNVAVAARKYTAALHVTRHDGAALNGDVAYTFGPATSDGTTSTGHGFAAGETVVEFPEAGLWMNEFQYRNVAMNRSSLPVPHFAARGVVAAWALLPAEGKVNWTARAVTFGTLDVRVVDAAGNPRRCAVGLQDIGRAEFLYGQTDATGAIHFEGVSPIGARGRAYVHVIGEATGREILAKKPADAELPMTVLLPEPVTVLPGTHAAVTLRPQAVGYVRGTLTAEKPGELSQLSTYVETTGAEAAELQVDKATGAFLAGPFAPGPIRLMAIGHEPFEPAGSMRVRVEGGKVANVAWKLEALPAVDIVGRTTGTVFMSDGKTPADGATVAVYGPGQTEPMCTGTTDGRGRIHVGMTAQHTLAPVGLDVDVSAGPYVVAALPGRCGAVIAPLPKAGDALRMVLPFAHGIGGTVTLNGAALATLPQVSRVRVRAQYLGAHGAALSLETMADADGRFVLAGLTPGKYAVQAAIDDVWLSEPQELEIPEGLVLPTRTPPPPLSIDIRPPGAPVEIRLTDAAGRPVTGRAVTLERRGPLANLWPAQWTSDGAGVVTIPTLEAGGHTVRVRDSEQAVSFDVPALPADAVRVGLVIKP